MATFSQLLFGENSNLALPRIGSDPFRSNLPEVPSIGNDPIYATLFSNDPTALASSAPLPANGISYDPIADVLTKQSTAKPTTGGHDAQAARSYSTSAQISPGDTSQNPFDLGPGDGGIYQWRDEINQASKDLNVPAAVLGAIMLEETGGVNHTSPNGAGAVGLMQIIPRYHQDLIRKYGDPTDPNAALHIAAALLRGYHDQAFKEYGNIDDLSAWRIAAEAYFAGWSGRQNPSASDGGQTVKGYGDDFITHMQQISASHPGAQNPPSSHTANTVLGVARSLLGTPYKMVGNADDPRNGYLDCSGLVRWSYRQAGINLPRTAQQQYDATQRISAQQLQPGDLVFFTQTYPAGVPVSHVGIYLGNNQMIDASLDGVSIDDLSQPYWQEHLYAFGRVPA